MTAVTREAEERLKLSSRISSSIRFSLTGLHVGWTTKMSEPRTFSSIWQKVSPSEKLKEDTLPAVRFRYSQISCTSAGWARPPKIFSSPAIVSPATTKCLGNGLTLAISPRAARDSGTRRWGGSVLPACYLKDLVGAGGFEPP